MLPKRIKVKAFFNSSINTKDFVPIFHKWIQNQVFANHLLLDVADYQHVYQGPSLILVGHEADFAVDLEKGRAGFIYIRKRSWPEGDLTKRVHTVLENIISAAKLLTAETSLSSKLDLSELELNFSDRLITPNKPEIHETLKEPVQKALNDFYDQGVELEPLKQDARRSLGFHIKVRSN